MGKRRTRASAPTPPIRIFFPELWRRGLSSWLACIPKASRPARRFALSDDGSSTCMISSRRCGHRTDTKKLRGSILERDLELAGSANPMLAVHGTVFRARQYSGRKVPDGWSCPYHRGESSTAADPLGEMEPS